MIERENRATNGCGWEIQEFILPAGWNRSSLFPDTFTSYHKAMTHFCDAKVADVDAFRVYAAIKE